MTSSFRIQRCPQARIIGALTVSLALVGCGETAGTGLPEASPFLQGTTSDRGIALSVSSLRRSVLMVQTGSPNTRLEIPLGASTTITPVDLSVRGTRAAVPLGNAASVALLDLNVARVDRVFTFPSGNATGSAWVNDSTFVVCNQTDDYCGRVRVSQTALTIADTVRVTQFPTDVVVSGGRVFVVSSNLDENFAPAGNGVVTELSAATNRVVRTFTVGRNPQAITPSTDGTRLFVTNSGDFGSANGTLSIINLATNTVDAPVTGFGEFPGPVTVDASGRVFVSSFDYGTMVWNSTTRAFVRGTGNTVCARLTGTSGTPCRGASGAAVALNGNLYQAFFGSAAQSQPSYLFVFDGSTFALRDSVPMPVGTNSVRVLSFVR
jgi:DNA-binding beta-propeller fold protein YncE